MYKDRFQSLDQILEEALRDNQIKYFAYALSQARVIRDPTPRTINLVLEVIFTRGIKWIQVLQRLAIQKYELVFQICKQQYMIYPSLVNVAHPIHNQQSVAYLQSKIFELLQNNTTNHQVLWCAFVELICRGFRLDDCKEQFMLNLLNHINSTLSNNPHFFDSISQLNSSIVKDSLQTIYSVSGYKVILCIGKLYKFCCRIFRKRMSYLLAKREFNMIVSWIRQQYQHILQNGMNVMQQNGGCQLTIKQDLINCLVQLQCFVELQDITIVGMQNIIKVLLSYGLISNSNLDAEQRLNWQYGLICNQYGDDIASHIARTTIHLAKSIPSFITTYINQLNCVQLPEGQIIMRYIVVNKQLLQRPDLISRILQPFLDRVVNTLQPYTNHQFSQLQFCRKIRLLMFYSQILKQKYFTKMLQCILDMIGKQHHTSFCFLQGYNLFKQIINKSNSHNVDRNEKCVSRTAQLIKEQIISIVNSLLLTIARIYQRYPLSQNSQERQGTLYKILQLFQELLSKNITMAQKILPQILKKFCYWTIDYIYASWRRGIKTSGVINFLMRITKLSIMLLGEDYINLQEPIYDVLELLKSSNIKDYYDDLLEILVFVINQDVEIAPRICFAIVELQRVIEDSKSMYSVINVVKALCQKNTAASVLYNWPDLCLFIFNLFTNSLNSLDQSYPSYYFKEFYQILIVFGTFIQVYSPYLQENKQVTNNILYTLQRIGQNQIKLQLFLIMNHLQLIHNYEFNGSSDIPNLQLRNTFKLICLYYCDKLRQNYRESLLNEFMHFYKIYQEKKHRKVFKSQPNNTWPCLQISISVYISETLQQLKKKRCMDSMELGIFRREFGLSY